MWLSTQLLFAGVTKYVVHWGFWGTATAVLLALGVFAPAIPVIGPFLSKIRKDFFLAAGVCVAVMYGMYTGAKDATARCVAKEVVIEKTVTKAVDKTKTPAAKRQRDRWDNPEY